MIAGMGALAGLIAVALGAFGAHALQSGFDDKQAGWWDTATLYLLVHAALATAVSISDRAKFGVAALTLLIGAVIFAGTLYAMALGAPRWLGAATPIGGVGLLIGWGLMAWTALKA
jgi:uncharacterized membrane protein YgdD (TMEM256/DUF423 family)